MDYKYSQIKLRTMNRKSLMSSGLDYGPTDVTRINDKPRNPEIDHSKPQPEDILFGGRVADHPEISEPGNPLNYITEEKQIPQP